MVTLPCDLQSRVLIVGQLAVCALKLTDMIGNPSMGREGLGSFSYSSGVKQTLERKRERRRGGGGGTEIIQDEIQHLEEELL